MIIDYMENLPDDKRYGFNPVKLFGLYNREGDNTSTKWVNTKHRDDPSIGRNTMIDFIQR